ncbi:MAG: twin-arginine translocase TatA/TatE family subunit [Coriobacteriia bacterium]|nr:twin-arginine translocase TatA/TatE family subunit [Coriobacteriia bacterium]
MFSLGGSELLIIAVVVLLLFGPDKIPQLARTIGRFTREFNKYRDIMESTVRAEFLNADPDPKTDISVEDRIAKAAAAGSEARDKQAADAAVDAPAEPGDAGGVSFAVTDEEDEEEE